MGQIITEKCHGIETVAFFCYTKGKGTEGELLQAHKGNAVMIRTFGESIPLR